MKRTHKTLLLWVLLILMFVSIWQVLSPDPASRSHAAPPEPTSYGSAWFFAAAVIPIIVLLGWAFGSSGKVARAVSEAQGLMQQGRFGEAERSLDGLDRINRLAVNRSAVDLTRTFLHFQRGQLAEALRHADAVLAARLPVWWRAVARRNAMTALGLRAVLRAAHGDTRPAREDIARIRSSQDMPADARARAELAELLLLEREGDRAAWIGHLDRTRTLLLEATGSGERAIVRAFEGMAGSAAAPAYRRKAMPDAGASAPETLPMAEWVARFAPSAAPFVTVPARRAWGPEAAKQLENAMLDGLSEAARRSVDAAHAPGKSIPSSRSFRLIVPWVVLVGLFLVVWRLAGETLLPLWALIPAIGALVIGWFTWLISRGRRKSRALHAAAAHVTEGDLERAETCLEPLSRDGDHHIAANAALLLADSAHRRAEFASSLEHCDQGLQHVAAIRQAQQQANSKAPAEIAPGSVECELTALRAFVLAVLGREPEALAELQRLSAETTPLAHLRVRTLQLLRRGQLAGAAQCMDHFPGLSRRDELLAELIRHAATPAAERNDTEVERFRTALQRDARMQRWIEQVAPEALEALDPSHARATP